MLMQTRRIIMDPCRGLGINHFQYQFQNLHIAAIISLVGILLHMETLSSVGLCFKIYTLYVRGVRFSSCPSLGTSALITSREWHTGKGASGGSVVAMTTQRNLIGRTLLPPILYPHTFFPHTIPPNPKAPNCLNYHFKMQRKYRTVKWVLIARGVLETDAVLKDRV